MGWFEFSLTNQGWFSTISVTCLLQGEPSLFLVTNSPSQPWSSLLVWQGIRSKPNSSYRRVGTKFRRFEGRFVRRDSMHLSRRYSLERSDLFSFSQRRYPFNHFAFLHNRTQLDTNNRDDETLCVHSFLGHWRRCATQRLSATLLGWVAPLQRKWIDCIM